jgi:hypothetical protein
MPGIAEKQDQTMGTLGDEHVLIQFIEVSTLLLELGLQSRKLLPLLLLYVEVLVGLLTLGESVTV